MKTTLFSQIQKLFPSTIQIDEIAIVISDDSVEFLPQRFETTPLEWRTVISGSAIVMNYEDIPQRVYNKLMAFKERNAVCPGYALYVTVDKNNPDYLYEDLPF